MKSMHNTAVQILARARRLPAIFVIATLLTCFFKTASAQRGNQSDWNVPPPVAPGTITRGDRDGRIGNGGVAVLTFTDVAVPQVILSSISGPELAAISTVPPDANAPAQPVSENVIAALPDVPLPDVPEIPAMPDRTISDTPEPPAAALPMPDEPEMPPVPTLPTTSANGTTQITGNLPLMPGIPGQTSSFVSPPADQIMWNMPGVPQNIPFILN